MNIIDSKQAKTVIKTIKQIDVIIWSLDASETRTNLADSRYHLWKSLDLAGFNFDVEYNLVKVVNQ